MRAANSRAGATKAKGKKAPAAPTAADFDLEPPPIKGEIPERVLDELVHAKTSAKDYARAFADAVKAQAKKHDIKPGALRKYVTAREADKLADGGAEITDIAKLIG